MLATSNALPFSEPKALIVCPLIHTERPLQRMKSNINKWLLVMKSTFNLRFISPRCLRWAARLHFKIQGKLHRYLSVNWRSDMLQASVLHCVLRRLLCLQTLQVLWCPLSRWEFQAWENGSLITEKKKQIMISMVQAIHVYLDPARC